RQAAASTAAPRSRAAPPIHGTLPSPEPPPTNTAAATTAPTPRARTWAPTGTRALGIARHRTTRSGASDRLDLAALAAGSTQCDAHKSFTLAQPTAQRQPRDCA